MTTAAPANINLPSRAFSLKRENRNTGRPSLNLQPGNHIIKRAEYSFFSIVAVLHNLKSMFCQDVQTCFVIFWRIVAFAEMVSTNPEQPSSVAENNRLITPANFSWWS